MIPYAERRSYRRMVQPPRHGVNAGLEPTGYEKTLACLRCETVFESPDKRSVRHCDTCRRALISLEEAGD